MTRTGDIGLVTIVSESAVAAGVRRVEAKTADEARRHLNDEARRVRMMAALLKSAPDDAQARLENVLDERRKMERELSEARRKLAMGGGGKGADEAIREVAGTKLFARIVTGVEMKDLKSLADEAKTQIGSGVVAIIGVADDGKAGAVVAVTSDLTARFNAVDFVRIAAQVLGGKGGGGRPDMAQAGGPDGAQAAAALAAMSDYMAQHSGA